MLMVDGAPRRRFAFRDILSLFGVRSERTDLCRVIGRPISDVQFLDAESIWHPKQLGWLSLRCCG